MSAPTLGEPGACELIVTRWTRRLEARGAAPMTVRIEIGIDSVMPEILAPFWADALGYEVGDVDRAGTYLDLVPPDPGLPVVYLQRVPEPKADRKSTRLNSS